MEGGDPTPTEEGGNGAGVRQTQWKPSDLWNLKNQGLEPELSNEKRAPGWLGYIGDYTTQFVGNIIHHYKDPY